ncbi:hypothetical protein [Maricaulis sp. MIT060901]|uniref:hypothetical protein n=1 Tax=Maricaulis sp. MIT060901 TaxID=3096993 RepID=UPI003999D19E
MLVVHSAIRGVSDALEDLVRTARDGDGSEALAFTKARHIKLADELDLNGEALLATNFDELDRLSAGLALTGDASPRLHARILCQGELMATTLGAPGSTRSAAIANGWTPGLR